MKDITIAKNNLLSIAKPEEWKDWIFHLQSNLIASGYVEGLTQVGRQDLTARMQGLHDFFSDINEKAKQS